jgi:hypothetical protein
VDTRPTGRIRNRESGRRKIAESGEHRPDQRWYRHPRAEEAEVYLAVKAAEGK